ncbi:hypothetical protein [Frigoribacterium salinisoli]
MDDEAPETETTVVRLFVDHAASPVWFSEPRDWDEMGFDADLTDDLRRWDAEWYSSRDREDFEWIADEPEIEHRRRGVALAQRITDALGAPFVVEVEATHRVAPDGGPCRERVSSEQEATQPRAAARFRAWAQEARAEHARIRAAVADGGGRWVAYAPLSGHTFEPGLGSTGD